MKQHSTCHKPHKHFSCSSTEVKEPQKLAEIVDKFGNLRFKVAMTSHSVPADGTFVPVYSVCVVNCMAPERLVVAEWPVDGEPYVCDYAAAEAMYHKMVESYRCLVEAETRDHQCIDAQRERIGYKHTMPECCQTCRFARRRRVLGKHVYGVSGKLMCTNLFNLEDLQRGMHHACDEQRLKCDERHGHHHRADDFAHDINFPDVDLFGICSRYMPAAEPHHPYPGQDTAEFIDTCISRRLDNRISSVANSILSGALSSDIDIDTKVDSALDAALRNPSISATLMLPVEAVMKTDAMTQQIANAAAEAMHEATIVGNNAVRPFDDKDGDGWQDADEPFLDEDDVHVTVLGGLGA